MRFLVLISAVMYTSLAPADVDADTMVSGARMLAAVEMPDLTWDNDLALVADVNGDDRLDVMLVGLSKDCLSVVVALASEQGSSVSSIQFGLSNTLQMAACGTPTGWDSFRRSERPFNALGAYPPGYEECLDCLEFTLLDDGGCDPLNLYWNAVSKKIDWWRA